MRGSSRFAAAVVLAAVCVSAPAAFATSDPEVITTTFESWYQPDPTCDALGSCVAGTPLPVSPPVGIPTSPYPEGTLHVAWTGAAETARSYIYFPLFRASGDIASAVLDIPLDTAAENGAAASELSTVMACLATGILENAAGSFAPPPEVDCTDAILLTYVEEPTPHLTGDLTPLIDALRSATGIALLPDAVNSGTDAWRVVFSSHRRPDVGQGPPTLTVTIADPIDGEPGEEPVVEEPVVVGNDTGGAPVVHSPPIGGVAPIQPVAQPRPAPEVAQPTQPPSAPAPEALPVAVDDGQTYPEVFLLPLLLLVLVPFVGRSLTSDLQPTPDA